MGTRIKGQEVELLLINNGRPESTITLVKNFEFTPELEILTEGYLGQTTEQKDSIFMGISGKMDVHFENQDILKFMGSIIDKARRRLPGSQINIKATLNFPNGQRPRVLLPRVEFGPMPMNFGGRKEFGSVNLAFEGSEINFIY